jgi:hypothetical protein
MGSVIERIEKEISSWPYVTAEPRRFGGLEFRFNKSELGHLHGERVADLPFPMTTRNELKKFWSCIASSCITAVRMG